jgi:hypothetical protein
MIIDAWINLGQVIFELIIKGQKCVHQAWSMRTKQEPRNPKIWTEEELVG